MHLCEHALGIISPPDDVFFTARWSHKSDGIEGLLLGKAKGRERKRSAEQESELYTVISEKLPKDVGLEPFCNWTAPLACKYVKEHFVVDFSERGISDQFLIYRRSFQ